MTEPASGTFCGRDASTPSPAEALTGARRLVVKIGSALLVADSGEIRREWLEILADDVARCRDRGQEVIVVSSGAIAIGRRHLELAENRLRLEEKQAAAATGQIRLAHAYQEALARHGLTVAQILLTLEDTEERRRHLNARATFAQLLRLGAVPVVNENDTIATAEIRFGDNDRLAARVAQMTSADMLVLLSDIDGLYTADPRKQPDARHLATVREIGPEIEAMAGEAAPGYSSGGMVTKLAAARIAMNAGCCMLIARGVPEWRCPDRLRLPRSRPERGRRCFCREGSRVRRANRGSPGPSTRRAWSSSTTGPLEALRRGSSLLPAGVVAVEGEFERGDAGNRAHPLGRRGRARAFRLLQHRHSPHCRAQEW